MLKTDAVSLLREAIRRQHLDDYGVLPIDEIAKYLKLRYSTKSVNQNRINFIEPRHKEVEEARKEKLKKLNIKYYKAKLPEEKPQTLLQKLFGFRKKKEEVAEEKAIPLMKKFTYSKVAEKFFPLRKKSLFIKEISQPKVEVISSEEVDKENKEENIEQTDMTKVNTKVETKKDKVARKVQNTPFRGVWPSTMKSSLYIKNRMKPGEFKDIPMKRLSVRELPINTKLKSLGERQLLAIMERKERADKMKALERMATRQESITELKARAEALLNRAINER